MARKSISPPPTRPIEGDLDVFSIHQQWERLLPLLAEGKGAVQLDLSSVGDLDLSGLQLLWALERDLKVKGVQLSLTGVKEEWPSRFTSLGLASLFEGDAS